MAVCLVFLQDVLKLGGSHGGSGARVVSFRRWREAARPGTLAGLLASYKTAWHRAGGCKAFFTGPADSLAL